MKLNRLIYAMLPLAIMAVACSKDEDEPNNESQLQNNQRLAELQAGVVSEVRGGIADAGGFILYSDAGYKYKIIIETGSNVSSVNFNNLKYSLIPYVNEEKYFEYHGNAQSGYWFTQKEPYICGMSEPFSGIDFADFNQSFNSENTLTEYGLSQGKVFGVWFMTGAGNIVWVKVRLDEVVQKDRQNDAVVSLIAYTPV